MANDRWALCLVGAWMAGTVCITVVATQNFHTIDRLLAAPENAAFRATTEQLGSQNTRDLLRYLSSELNRLYFQWWNLAQLALGVPLLILTAQRRDAAAIRIIVGAMLVVVAVMLLWMTPEITRLGRRLDFVPRHPAPPEADRFWTLHGVYTTLEIAKLALALVVAVRLTRHPRSVYEAAT